MASQISTSAGVPEDWFDDTLETKSADFDTLAFPVLPLRDTVIFPHMVAPLFVGRERSIRAIEAALESSDGRIVVLTQRDEEIEDPEPEDLHEVGTEVTVARKLRMPDGLINVWVQGQRVKVVRFEQAQPYLRATVTPVEETVEEGLSTDALMRAVLALFEKVVQLSRSIPEDAYVAAMNAEEPGDLADLIASLLELDVERRQEILEVADRTERLQRLSIMLASELDVLELENRIHSQVQQEVDRSQREYFLREQMRVIQNELGEGDPHLQEVAALKVQLLEAKLPDEVREKAEKEISRLATMPSAPEVAVITHRLALELPWESATDDSLDISHAKVLEQSHYGLPKAKGASSNTSPCTGWRRTR